MSLNHVTAGGKAPQSVNVIIEIPANSGPVKYEVDKSTGTLHVDRFLSTAMTYPANYGFIPQTLSEDGDPVDVLVLTSAPLISGCVIEARPIGLLAMEDESGKDAKILAVPIAKLDKMFEKIHSHQDISPVILNAIAHFFEHYKDLEANKWTKIEDWHGPETAIAEIAASLKRYAK